MFGRKKYEVGNGEYYATKNFFTYTGRPGLLGQ